MFEFNEHAQLVVCPFFWSTFFKSRLYLKGRSFVSQLILLLL